MSMSKCNPCLFLLVFASLPGCRDTQPGSTGEPLAAQAQGAGPAVPSNDELPANGVGDTCMNPRIVKSDEEWRRELTPEQYRVLREKGTERAFTGEHYATKDSGVYRCAACGNELFSSETKFDSGTGWPSFYQPLESANVAAEVDSSHGMHRTEVLCARCGGHLGHVFDDGPQPTGLRYCINSAALTLQKEE
jgi:peptide-methionine (R)-S-oxide reductase